MYKAQLVFIELPFTPYYEYDEKLILDIKEKVNNKEITLPIIPTKDMQIDLSTFNIDFEFTEKQTEAIDDCNQLYDIDNIIVTSSNVEIWLS
jgi:hypothetical protein